MKTVVAVTRSFEEYFACGQKSFLLPLKGYSVSYEKQYTLKEIKEIRSQYSEVELFVVMNKNIFNQELEECNQILKELDKLALQGILFYDYAILALKKRLGLQTPLVWNQTHMVTNSKTCDYLLHHQVEYAVMAGELSKEEILDLVADTNMKFFYTLVSLPIAAHSKRNLLTNYAKTNQLEKKSSLSIHEKVTNQDYLVTEEEGGSSFFYQAIPNHYAMLKELETSYVILNESYIEHDLFMKILIVTNQYLSHEISFSSLEEKITPLLTHAAPFLQNKTIYQVKKEKGKENLLCKE